jgi:hypothetical protein
MKSRASQTIRRRILHLWLPVVVFILAARFAAGGSITLDFEGFPDGTILTTQYSGLTFTNAIVLTAGISLNEFEFPPHSGVSVASDNNGPITIDFGSPITSFSGYFTYVERLTLAGFDAADTEVASAASVYSSNDALFGDPGSSPNELIQISYAAGMSSVTITGDPNGGSFVMDDITSTAAAVPEPGSLASLIAGSLIIVAYQFFKIKMKHSLLGLAGIAFVVMLCAGGVWLFARPQSPQDQSPLHSGQQATQASVTIPANPPLVTVTHTIGTATATPMLIAVGTSTQVTFTIQIADPAAITNSVNLLSLGATGTQPIILGTMQNTGNGVYTMQQSFNEPSPTPRQFEVSAAFQGSLKRVLSNVVTISVWNVLNSPGLGLTALYPPTLYLTNSSTVGGYSLFALDSSPGGVAIGGALPSGSSEAQTGYGVRIAVMPYVASGTFNINQYLSTEYPNSAADVSSIASVSIGGQAGYEFTFQNEEGGGQPRAITYYNGNVYEISYVSTNYLPGFSDAAGLNTFNGMLHTVTFN